jgi:ABC-2 type transport system ATP-binding protein
VISGQAPEKRARSAAGSLAPAPGDHALTVERLSKRFGERVALDERGVTIFLTTHRLEEAERLCDRVAILNTTLRLIGRPDELRKQLFRRCLDIRLRAPINDPEGVLGALREVEGWEQAPSGYTLTVSDPDLAAPALARALVTADADILSIVESHHSLEDVYLELIDEDVEARSR